MIINPVGVSAMRLVRGAVVWMATAAALAAPAVAHPTSAALQGRFTGEAKAFGYVGADAFGTLTQAHRNALSEPGLR